MLYLETSGKADLAQWAFILDNDLSSVLVCLRHEACACPVSIAATKLVVRLTCQLESSLDSSVTAQVAGPWCTRNPGYLRSNISNASDKLLSQPHSANQGNCLALYRLVLIKNHLLRIHVIQSPV